MVRYGYCVSDSKINIEMLFLYLTGLRFNHAKPSGRTGFEVQLSKHSCSDLLRDFKLNGGN